MVSAVKACIAGSIVALLLSSQASAADRIRVASGHKGLWDMTMVVFGNTKGIYAKHGIELEIQWAKGGAALQQAAVTGSVDIAFGTGVLGDIGAFGKGAPIEIIAAHMTGSSDLFWYVKADSDIRSFADTNGKTVSFSRPGSSTNLIAAGLLKKAGTTGKLVSTGGISATMTQVLTGQVDVGWSAVPIGLEREAKGEIRVLGNGNMVPGVKDQTVRAHIVNKNFLSKNEALVKRFLKAHQEVLDWAYTTDEALEIWAKMRGLSLKDAKAARDRGYPRDSMRMFPIRGIDKSIAQAVGYKRLDKPLSASEKAKLLAPSEAMAAALK